jgi:AcrR family transcriptional regulator
MTAQVERPQAQRPLRADAVRNRLALIRAAETVFTERGLSATLDDIAAAAGLNVATAYRHFANKFELADAFLDQKIDDVIHLAHEAAEIEDPWLALLQFLDRVVHLMAADRGLRDVFEPALQGDWRQRISARIEQEVDPLVSHLLSRAQQAAVVRQDLGPGDLGVIVQMLAAVAALPGDHRTLLPRYLALVSDGLRPSTTPLPGTAPAPAEGRPV